MPIWVKEILDQWVEVANLTSAKLFRRVHKMRKTWLTEKAVWHVVREYAAKAAVEKFAPQISTELVPRHPAGRQIRAIPGRSFRSFRVGTQIARLEKDINRVNGKFLTVASLQRGRQSTHFRGPACAMGKDEGEEIGQS